MIGRLIDAILRRLSEQPPSRQLRPNELSREVARSERLRRQSLRGEASVDRSPRSLEEQRPRRNPVEQAPDIRPKTEPWQVAALKSRSGLRQALLLKEILDPPLALRDYRSRDSDR